MNRSEGQGNRLRFFLTLAALLIAGILILYVLGVFGGGSRGVSARKLRCVVSQQVTPFGDRVLYYDGNTLFCLNAGGTEQWKYALGPGARFSASETVVAAWIGTHLHILNRNGRATYNDRLPDPVQFAKPGRNYVAAVVGDGFSPTLIVKDVNGLAVDSETVAYADKMILDLGFFENGDYLWTTALDAYGIAPVTVLNVFRVGSMNTGEVDLGEEITYKVVYSGGKLHVVNTRDMNLYDYRGTLDPFSRQLVYGWQMMDSLEGAGDGVMLFVPVLQTAQEQQITQLRVLTSAKKDSRYTLPDLCAGAWLRGGSVYAVSSDTVYRADLSAQRFSALKLPLNRPVTGFIGKLTNGAVLVNCGQDVFLVSLP